MLIESLSETADEIDEAFLRRIEKILIVQARLGSQHRSAVQIPKPPAWLIGVVPIDLENHPEDQTVVDAERMKADEETHYSDSETGYLRFSGISNFGKAAKRRTWSSRSGARAQSHRGLTSSRLSPFCGGRKRTASRTCSSRRTRTARTPGSRGPSSRACGEERRRPASPASGRAERYQSSSSNNCAVPGRSSSVLRRLLRRVISA